MAVFSMRYVTISHENVCGDFDCSASTRKDGKAVQFKRVK